MQRGVPEIASVTRISGSRVRLQEMFLGDFKAREGKHIPVIDTFLALLSFFLLTFLFFGRFTQCFSYFVAGGIVFSFEAKLKEKVEQA